jgi:hypothetical protein
MNMEGKRFKYQGEDETKDLPNNMTIFDGNDFITKEVKVWSYKYMNFIGCFHEGVYFSYFSCIPIANSEFDIKEWDYENGIPIVFDLRKLMPGKKFIEIEWKTRIKMLSENCFLKTHRENGYWRGGVHYSP